ncbi:ADP-ribosylglycohydrolase family protein [Bacillus sp. NPDC094106]|uniref:ADP-ribosylglycohydrolase family protein n=1 Tax=Bacillus sp. NPDC094106 TaxID=3363949 RepID=UPI00382A75FF
MNNKLYTVKQSIFKRLFKMDRNKNQENPVLSGLLGFCVGDALGVPVEFQLRDEINKITTMTGYGTHNQPPGTWSDDSSLTFCLAESLIRGYDLNDIKQKMCDWYYYGYWNVNDKLPFDIGRTTFKALSKIKAGINLSEAGEQNEKDNGNGSLMRVLPLAYYLKEKKTKDKIPLIEEVSGITHAHIRSKIACSIYVEFAIQLLNYHSPIIAYEKMKEVIIPYYKNKGHQEELNHFKRILEHDISTYQEHEIKSTGYVVDSLEACLWSFLTTTTFSDAVLKAVNLGEDTDTIGALTGGLAGIYYGVNSIPKRWVRTISRKSDIYDLSNRFCQSLLKNK